jgi:copper chaperone NosL
MMNMHCISFLEEVLVMITRIVHAARPVTVLLLITLVVMVLVSCSGKKDVKPVNLVKDDKCSSCGATIVMNSAFASEVIGADGTVYKFDDFKCLESFLQKSDAPRSDGIFVKDYDARTWISYDQAAIVKTGIATPNRSGKVAFKDSTRAKEFALKNPPM